MDPDKLNLTKKDLLEFCNKVLETGLTQNQTVNALHLAVHSAIENNPEKFEVFVKFFLNASMYLLDEDDELLDIEEMLRLAR